jgi:8-oxo-dGTP pyrophosphatase MutT (NUDIX family)
MMHNMPCNEDLFNHIKSNLERFTRRSQEQENLKRAAVAITIVDIDHNPDLYDIPHKSTWNRNAAIILTRRASRLKNHAGQWALPGGRMDAGENPAETALRELEEEVGLRLDVGRVIGHLDDYSTRSGFIISPVVIWGGTGLTLTPNHAEVESIHRIPLAEFLRTDAPILQDIPGSDNPVLLMPIGTGYIASPTAAMIYQFREVAIFGRSIRVAHYEQPFFAWQ